MDALFQEERDKKDSICYTLTNFLIPLQELFMKTDLFFYTGTGNSLWAARTVAHELGNTEIIPILWMTSNPVQTSADAVGIVFPASLTH